MAGGGVDASWRWHRRFGRWVRDEFGNLEVWLLLAAVLTPLLVATAAVVRSEGSAFDTWRTFPIAVALSVIVLVDCLLAVHFSSAGWPWIRWVLAIAMGGLIVSGLWLAWDEVSNGDADRVNALWVGLLVGAAIMAVTIRASSDTAPPSRSEMLRGALALGAALLGLSAIVVALATSWPANACLRFCGVLVPVVVALWVIGVEWSRRWLLGASLVALLGVVSVLIAIGYDDLRSDPLERVAAARTAQADLALLRQDRYEELRNDLDDAVTELDGRVARAEREEPDAARTASLAELRELVGDRPPTPDWVDDDNAAEVSDGTETATAAAALRAAVSDLAAVAAADGLDNWWSAAVADARMASEAWSALATYDPSADDVAGAIDVAEGCANEVSGEQDVCPPGGEEAPVLAGVLADLDLAQARYRAAVTGDKTDVDAAAALAAAHADGRGTAEDSEPVSFLDALQHGPEVLSTAVNGNREQPLVPGPLGWVLFAVLALGFWSWLLRTNARQMAGPVHIDPVAGTAAGGSPGGGPDPPPPDDPPPGGGAPEADVPRTDADSTLRVAVLQNLREPGAVPGSEALETVTDLVAIPGVSPGWLDKALKALGDLVGKPYGYTIAVEVAEDADQEKDRRFRALARVKDRRSRLTLGTQLIEEPTLKGAVRAAGLWASGFILARSTRIPSWAAWNAETAKALSTANEATPRVADLEPAARSAPNSGLLLYLLGGAYEVEGRSLDALMAITRAVASHPHYAIARYRLGAALSMMGAHRPNIFAYASSDERASLLNLLRLAVERMELRGGHRGAAREALEGLGGDPLTPRVARKQLLALTGALFVDMEARTRYLPVVASALRRSDRDHLFHLTSPFVSGRRRRRAWHDLARSARLIQQDQALRERQRFLDEAANAETSWQVTYNAACAAAMDLNKVRAIELLEACLVKRDVHQLVGPWLAQDPDLARLRDEPRFQRLATRFGGGDGQ